MSDPQIDEFKELVQSFAESAVRIYEALADGADLGDIATAVDVVPDLYDAVKKFDAALEDAKEDKFDAVQDLAEVLAYLVSEITRIRSEKE